MNFKVAETDVKKEAKLEDDTAVELDEVSQTKNCYSFSIYFYFTQNLVHFIVLNFYCQYMNQLAYAVEKKYEVQQTCPPCHVD